MSYQGMPGSRRGGRFEKNTPVIWKSIAYIEGFWDAEFKLWGAQTNEQMVVEMPTKGHETKTCTTDWMNQWIDESVNQWISESQTLNHWIKKQWTKKNDESMSLRNKESMNQWIKRVSETMNESQNRWIKESKNHSMNPSINDPMNQRIKEPMNHRINEQIHQRIRELTGHWRNEPRNQWISESPN
jgi:hypothetical protein